MPAMDFTDVLTAVEFNDTITVKSVTNTIGDDGVSVPGTPTIKTMSAIVVPGSANLRRLDDGSRISGVINIYARFPLSGGTKSNDVTSRAPDVVTWRGRQYIVAAVEDYSAFGPGFVRASCDLIQLNPAT